MTTLVVAEDEAMLRTALVTVLERAGFAVTAVGSGDDVLPAVARTRPAAVVLDIHLPGLDGIDLAHALRHDGGHQVPPLHPRVLLLTAVGRPALLARALAAPVDGLLLKSATADELVGAVRSVLAGDRVFDPELLQIAGRAGPALTQREQDVLSAAQDGAPVNDVAARLFLAPTTVRNHLTAILAKLGARNRHEAVQRARDTGWL